MQMQPGSRLAIKVFAAFGSFDFGQRAGQGRISSFDTYFYDTDRRRILIWVKRAKESVSL